MEQHPMKNYYEILEVNPKASQEVIEKAYKVLIKRYHPDLYTGEKQQYAQQMTQDINEAYRILSDDFLREQYNKELEKQQVENNRQNITQQPRRTKTEKKANHHQVQPKEVPLEQRMQNHKIGSFGSIIELTKELVYDFEKSREQRKEIKEVTKNDVLAIVLTIIIVIIIGVILWFIPFTNGWMRELLFENPLFNWIGGLFSK